MGDWHPNEVYLLDRITDWLIRAVTFIPAMFVAEDSPEFVLIRAMFALTLITIIVFLIAMRPFRSLIAGGWGKLRMLLRKTTER